MDDVTPQRVETIRRRQHATTEIRDSLRELRIQLALLNYRVGSQLDFKDVDLDCLESLELSCQSNRIWLRSAMSSPSPLGVGRRLSHDRVDGSAVIFAALLQRLTNKSRISRRFFI